jgi:hypothetical protein
VTPCHIGFRPDRRCADLQPRRAAVAFRDSCPVTRGTSHSRDAPARGEDLPLQAHYEHTHSETGRRETGRRPFLSEDGLVIRVSTLGTEEFRIRSVRRFPCGTPGCCQSFGNMTDYIRAGFGKRGRGRGSRSEKTLLTGRGTAARDEQ